MPLAWDLSSISRPFQASAGRRWRRGPDRPVPAPWSKADAYGLGALRVAPALYRAGARDFFVALASGPRHPSTSAGCAHLRAVGAHMEGADLAGLIPVLNSPEQFFRDRALRPAPPFHQRYRHEPAGHGGRRWAAIRAGRWRPGRNW